MLVWRMAPWRLSLNSDPLHDGRCTGLDFPAHISQRLHLLLRQISPLSVEIHGPSAIKKLWDLATTIADVVMCIPPVTDAVAALRRYDFITAANFLLNLSKIKKEPRELLEQKIREVKSRNPEYLPASWETDAQQELFRT